MRLSFAGIIVMAAAAAFVSCSKDNPVTPQGPTATLTVQSVSPISAALKMTIDSSTISDSTMLFLLRGPSATALTDTVYSGKATAMTMIVLDSNKGKWLTGGGGYYYQCIELKTSASVEIARSQAVAAVLPQGEYLPLQIGSVWVYSGYRTDTLTGSKITGSDFISVDSLVEQLSYEGFDDAYMMQHAVYKNNTIKLDTMYIRKGSNGDLWQYSRYGYTQNKMWQDVFRFDSVGVYTIHDTTEVNSGVNVHETVSGNIAPPATVIVPYGVFTARQGVVNVTVDVPGGILHDTIPAINVQLSKGFGLVGWVYPPFLRKGSGFYKLPKSEGSVENLIALRIKY